jgi:spoIIIJ-associated protein
MGLELDARVEQTADAVRVELEGEGGEWLVRRGGEALDALQHLANSAFRKQLSDSRHIVVDCLGFRRSKDAELRQMAKFLVSRAKETGNAQEIGPLNSYARRIVHLTVAEYPDMASESIGDAAMKTVIISVRR